MDDPTGTSPVLHYTIPHSPLQKWCGGMTIYHKTGLAPVDDPKKSVKGKIIKTLTDFDLK